MGVKNKTYQEIKENAREIHKGLKKKDSKKMQKLYHTLIDRKEAEIY